MQKGTRKSALHNNLMERYGRFFEKYDLPLDALRKWHRKYKTFKHFAEERAEVELTFRSYIKLALNAGIHSPDQIGRRRDQYQMGRKGDTGDYVKGNCRFITVQQNQDERKKNGGTAIGVEKAAQIRRGQTKETDECIRRMAEKLTGRTSDTHEYILEGAKKRGRPCVLISPEGKKYKGWGLNPMCKEFNLNQGIMWQVLAGSEKYSHHKGWTGYYLDKDT